MILVPIIAIMVNKMIDNAPARESRHPRLGVSLLRRYLRLRACAPSFWPSWMGSARLDRVGLGTSGGAAQHGAHASVLTCWHEIEGLKSAVRRSARGSRCLGRRAGDLARSCTLSGMVRSNPRSGRPQASPETPRRSCTFSSMRAGRRCGGDGRRAPSILEKPRMRRAGSEPHRTATND